MSKKDKNNDKPIEGQFELEKNTPIIKSNGERDYFAEYYRTYKNDYIDQYLKAYRELKDADAAMDAVDARNKNDK